jgi:hypothetical protein
MEKGTALTPNLYDGMKNMQVPEAAIVSATTGRKVSVSEVK